jgi:GntR family transcriptional repressor for pyruvate dehydrogenase complex
MTADDLAAELQLRQPKLADMVARVLRTRIVKGILADGARLPKQDELLREFKVSRPSLREALRILEAEGLLSVQRGNVGGAIVCAPSAQSSAYMFGLVLESRNVSLSDLADAIRNVEPLATAMCARREDRQQAVVPLLREALVEASRVIDDGVEFTRACRRFHEEAVRGCGNETLILMLGTLELMWSQQEGQWAQRAQEQNSYPTKKLREASHRAHSAILQAIERGEDDHAARLVRLHLSESQLYPLSEGKDAVVQAATPATQAPPV